jgi:hypothetical protein
MKAFKEYATLKKAIEEAGSIPPCQTSDAEAWFPESHQARDYPLRTAKTLCRTCPVQKECLIYALASNEQYGVWGGMTTAERQKLISSRRLRSGWTAVQHPATPKQRQPNQL